jgi:predicted HAD superfamily Cof-like phosphohydrolase
MRVEQEKVQLFMEKHNCETAETPTLVPNDLARLRHHIILEELGEYWQAAVEERDLVGVADAIGDLLYTVLGAAVIHGIDIQPIFDEIHRSNMTKTPLDPVTKKGGKGEGYEKARIPELLIIQSCSLTGAEC